MIIPDIHLIFDLIFDLILFNFTFNFHIGTTPVALSCGATAETNKPWPADAVRRAEVADPVPGCADPVRCREKFEGAAMVQSAFQLHNDQRKHRKSLEPI